MASSSDGDRASLAYGGYLGDRGDSIAEEVARAREVLASMDPDSDRGAWAAARFAYGKIVYRDVFADPASRWEAALAAIQEACRIWDADGTHAQRARGHTALGLVWRGLVTRDHTSNMENSLAHLGIALGEAQLAEESRNLLLADAHNGLATAYTYRDFGDRTFNIEKAIRHQELATALYDHGDRAVISLISSGATWARHPNAQLGLARADEYFRLALEAMGDEPLPPPHMVRLGKSAGRAALRRGDWSMAARMLRIAYDATGELLGQAVNPRTRSHELAEHGETTARLVFALAMDEQPLEAVRLANEARRRAASEDPDAPSQYSVGDLGAGVAYCYWATTVAGTAVIVLSNDDGEQSAKVLFSLDPNDDQVREGLGLNENPPGHGPGLSASLLASRSAGRRNLPFGLLNQLDSDLITQVMSHVRGAKANKIYLVPLSTMAELPIQALLLGRMDETELQAIHTSYVPTITSPVGRRVRHGREFKLVAIATSGSGNILGAVRGEIGAIAQRFPGTSVRLLGADASLKNVTEALVDATHVHISSHGVFSHVDPKNSYFELHAGERLTFAHLSSDRLLQNTQLVVATACNMGTSDAVHWPDAADGLAARLLDQTDANLIAPMRPVADSISALFASHLYAQLFAAESPLPSALAFARTHRWLRTLTHAGLEAWLSAHPGLLPYEQIPVPAVGKDSPLWNERPALWAPYSHFGRLA